MAFSLVQSATPNVQTSTTIVGTYGSNNAAGNLLLLVVSWATDATTDIVSVTDTAGNTWEIIESAQNVPTGDIGVAAYQVTSAIAGANAVTVTLGASVASGLAIAEFSSSGTRTLNDTSAVVDDAADADVVAAAVTSVASSNLVVALVGSVASRALTGDSPWTAIDAGQRASMLYNLAYPAGSTIPSGTWSSSTREAVIAATWSEQLTGSGGGGRGLIAARFRRPRCR